MYKIRTVKRSDIDNVIDSYENNFGLQISKDQYDLTFITNQDMMSHAAFDHNGYVLGHIGIYVGTLKGNNKKIGFRFSTFVDKQERGSGLYNKIMDEVLFSLKENNIPILYAWPNPINLVSCLKDNRYNPLPPQNTFEYRQNINEVKLNTIKTNNFKLIRKADMNEGLIISILDTYSKNFESLQSYTHKSMKNRLIRNQKVKYCISIENSEVKALIGLKELSKDSIYCAIHINDFAFDELINSTSNLIKSTFRDKKEIVFQSWIHHENRNGIRNAIKSGFRESIPIFNRGFYIVNNEDIKNTPLISCLSKSSMLDHDAF
tara:strand:- start:3183 stop:4139 length:957 start_codon:yes stop_codon:yes gene_type:complete